MPLFNILCCCPAQVLKHNIRVKLLAFILIFGFSSLDGFVQKPEYTDFPKKIINVLLWTPEEYYPFYYFGKGHLQFIKNNCSMTNCYITSDRNFFGGNISKFDAIASNGRNLAHYTKNNFPNDRLAHQKYIYFNTESADSYQVHNNVFDSIFNWTGTYRLDSDILFNYILIKDSKGTIVGPKENMKWTYKMDQIDDDFAKRLNTKTKAAAWFVSHCATRSKREQYVNKLQKEMKAFNLELDIYGSCGPLKCPLDRHADCEKALEKDYFFYMSLENSFAEDYVTEKLITALQHDTVPIVLGGANYSRFLPPGSYLNALEYSPVQLATLMDRLIKSPKSYQKFFRWKKYYTYKIPTQENLCNFCAVLNNETKFKKTSIYANFREWWNPHKKYDQFFSRL